ncbi:exosome complex exonuclease rrp4 [Rhizoctonia solani AG-1 IA]|uniref:Exosome complex exonuclease rrp4 n=1 Tax=Thanatephorus cucumeris (strain AG1-IA) TaxID=983506 RepID=L8X442_THACA|nr:exosome complex exonuclease rrp4 [Rhizoctonia solani AG-1 IA]
MSRGCVANAFLLVMFTISALPSGHIASGDDYYDKVRHHPDVMNLEFEADDELNSTASRLTSPGEPITSSQAFMRGHGTFVEDEQVIASVAGTVERVNKDFCQGSSVDIHRYTPEVGDLVVGRITEASPRSSTAFRWKVDVNSRQDGLLMLSSVNLPGGVQRRKLESDELQMRTFFEESDLLVAEVQSLFSDGSISLHTRSLRYGKLRNGQLVQVPNGLVRRLKSHFFSLPCGVDLILGLNGYIWVSKHVKEINQVGEEGFDAEPIDTTTSRAIIRVCNIIRVLARHHVPLTDHLIEQAYEWVIDQNIEIVDILNEENGESLVANVPALIARR